uniref:Ig-like domain-containing protein n=1 Tax=Panagrolaimus sp. JU765 TaxID=591449 RepID=A0AC34Q3W7_9BILA
MSKPSGDNGTRNRCPALANPVSVYFVPESETMNVDCTYTCSGKPEVKWFHDDANIAIDERRKIKTRGGKTQLRVKNPTPKDAGVYSLELTDKDSGAVAKKRFRVRVKTGRPKDAPLYVHPPSECWLDGNNLALRFNIRTPHNVKIEWKKDGELLNTFGRFEKTLKDCGGNEYLVQMIIPQPGEDDTGVYQCSIWNHAGRITTVFNIEGKTAKNAPVFLEPLRVREKLENGVHSTVFKVVFKGKDENPRVTWFNPKNQQVEDSPRTKIILAPGPEPGSFAATLEIRDYTPQDNGVFYCQIRNRTGKDTAVAEFLLNLELPEETAAVQSNENVVEKS